MIHQLDRAPSAARLLADARHERLCAEIVGHARRMREQLSHRGTREGIESAPAVEQLGSELLRERLIQRQAALPGEPDDHHRGHVLRHARDAKGIVRPKRTAASMRQPPRRAAPLQTDMRRLNARQRTRCAGRNLRLQRGL